MATTYSQRTYGLLRICLCPLWVPGTPSEKHWGDDGFHLIVYSWTKLSDQFSLHLG